MLKARTAATEEGRLRTASCLQYTRLSRDGEQVNVATKALYQSRTRAQQRRNRECKEGKTVALTLVHKTSMSFLGQPSCCNWLQICIMRTTISQCGAPHNRHQNPNPKPNQFNKIRVTSSACRLITKAILHLECHDPWFMMLYESMVLCCKSGHTHRKPTVGLRIQHAHT